MRAQLRGVPELGLDDGLHQGGQRVDHGAARGGAVTALKGQAGADVCAALGDEVVGFLCSGQETVDPALDGLANPVVAGVDRAAVVHVHPDVGAIEVAVLDHQRGGRSRLQRNAQRGGGTAGVAHGVAVGGRSDGEGGADAGEVGRGREGGGAGQAAAGDRTECAARDHHVAGRKACARVFTEGKGDLSDLLLAQQGFVTADDQGWGQGVDALSSQGGQVGIEHPVACRIAQPGCNQAQADFGAGGVGGRCDGDAVGVGVAHLADRGDGAVARCEAADAHRPDDGFAEGDHKNHVLVAHLRRGAVGDGIDFGRRAILAFCGDRRHAGQAARHEEAGDLRNRRAAGRRRAGRWHRGARLGADARGGQLAGVYLGEQGVAAPALMPLRSEPAEVGPLVHRCLERRP